MKDLAEGSLHRFSDWPNPALPKGPPGVYSIWKEDQFLYIGISWKEPVKTSSGTSFGLWGRLKSHASGRRSGDQFCIYICDRYVIGKLSTQEIQQIAVGHLSLDSLTRDYIHDNLSYRYVVTDTGNEARSIEAEIRRNGLPKYGQPILNPLTAR